MTHHGYEVEVRHRFDAGHRLPHLPGKCTSLHGHTWHVTATLAGPLDSRGIVVDMGEVKAELRKFVDDRLDHGTMLGADDPLVPLLRDFGKVFVFDPLDAAFPWGTGRWPTVENVAWLIGGHVQAVVDHSDVRLVGVRVSETPSNAATWRPV
ncbi:6-carboxytetrahydropterin synthase [Streptomyces sp. NPDC088739]|uniref:6-carboxytetrahydropterin synthase n=1 Tax=Streptomyces sp. NPDC088739 TaxID=3365882 RepID=UPI0037F8F67C